MKKAYRFLFFIFLAFAGLSAEPRCYRDLADHFFDDDKAIMQALSLHRVTESSWTPIIHELQRQSRSTYPLVRERARRIDPNPLEPFQPAAAEKLLMYSLLEMFQNVMNKYLITNPDGITDMFDYIRRHQAAWVPCFIPPEPQQ